MVDEDLDHIDSYVALFLVEGLDNSVLVGFFLGGEDVLDKFEEGGDDIREEGHELVAEPEGNSLPAGEHVALLGVNLLELAGLESDEDVDDWGEVGEEEFLADSVGNESDAFDSLPPELLVLRVDVLVEDIEEDRHGLTEVLVEVVLGCLCCSGDGGNCIFLDNRDSVLEHSEGLNQDIVEERLDEVLINLFKNICGKIKIDFYFFLLIKIF